MRRENVTRERERERERERKLMHGIADPLTKLSLTTTAGGINNRSVRESGESGGRREEGPGVSRVARGFARGAT